MGRGSKHGHERVLSLVVVAAVGVRRTPHMSPLPHNYMLLAKLFGMQEEPANRSFEQELAQLPVTDFSALDLCLWTGGHVFEALVLQLLRIRTSIRRLKVEVVNWVTIRLLSHVSSASACIFFTLFLVPWIFEVLVTKRRTF